MQPNLSVLELSSGDRGLDCMFAITREDWKLFPVIDNGQNLEECDALEHNSQEEGFSPAKACM